MKQHLFDSIHTCPSTRRPIRDGKCTLSSSPTKKLSGPGARRESICIVPERLLRAGRNVPQESSLNAAQPRQGLNGKLSRALSGSGSCMRTMSERLASQEALAALPFRPRSSKHARCHCNIDRHPRQLIASTSILYCLSANSATVHSPRVPEDQISWLGQQQKALPFLHGITSREDAEVTLVRPLRVALPKLILLYTFVATRYNFQTACFPCHRQQRDHTLDTIQVRMWPPCSRRSERVFIKMQTFSLGQPLTFDPPSPPKDNSIHRHQKIFLRAIGRTPNHSKSVLDICQAAYEPSTGRLRQVTVQTCSGRKLRCR
mmetsp:Transcript_43975/g.82189  ORF Transcript_43975/g.82189 Transcript_43975/m.82189 type:complete len:317 (-) Transcript_43975:247-1197(-)